MNKLLCRYLFYYPALYLRRQWLPKYLPLMLENQWQPAHFFRKIQLEKLILLIHYAKENVPYYSQLFKEVDPYEIKSLQVLHGLPVLTKELLKSEFENLKSKDVRWAIYKTTGGSTGNPVTILQSPGSVARIDAAYWRGYSWAGVSICDKQARFWGVPYTKKAKIISIAKDICLNRVRCSAFSFTEQELQGFFVRVNKFKPRFIYGYVSMLEKFASYLIENKLVLDFQVSAVISTSEVLTKYHRKLFERAFGCKVYNEYGCGEVGTIAHECEKGSLHISAENLILEIIDENGEPAKIGESGDIVVTELNNIAMPLIRYNLKDCGQLSKEVCPCGRGLPVLKNVAGRAYDTIRNKEGKSFHGEFFMYIFEELQNNGIPVSAFQVVQETYELFTILVVIDERFRRRMEKYVCNRVLSSYGFYAKLKFVYVEEIRREKSGKIRLIKTMLPMRRG